MVNKWAHKDLYVVEWYILDGKKYTSHMTEGQTLNGGPLAVVKGKRGGFLIIEVESGEPINRQNTKKLAREMAVDMDAKAKEVNFNFSLHAKHGNEAASNVMYEFMINWKPKEV